MPDTKGKVNLLDTVPVQCGHITTEWEGGVRDTFLSSV